MKKSLMWFALIVLSIMCGLWAGSAKADTITIGPAQVSAVTVDGRIFTWDANTEADLGGYGVCWSFDPLRNRAFVLVDNQCKDLGNVVTWDASTDADLNFDRPAGTQLDFGLFAYDGSAEGYDPATDNRSELQTELAGGGSASINFTQDAPPAKMGGVGLN